MGKLKHQGWSKRVERNILSVYVRASETDRAEGLHWYSHAHGIAQVMADKHGVSLVQSIGVIAALSPSLNWGLNVLQANEIIQLYQSGKRGEDIPTLGTYGRRNIIKVLRILAGEHPLDVLGGNKVRSFYANLLYPRSSVCVTIDRHAKGLAIGSISPRGATAVKDSIVTNPEYAYYSKHYVKLAELLGLIPNQLQAICWVTWRRLQGDVSEEKVPF